jgi:hypothetical protein
MLRAVVVLLALLNAGAATGAEVLRCSKVLPDWSPDNLGQSEKFDVISDWSPIVERSVGDWFVGTVFRPSVDDTGYTHFRGVWQIVKVKRAPQGRHVAWLAYNDVLDVNDLFFFLPPGVAPSGFRFDFDGKNTYRMEGGLHCDAAECQIRILLNDPAIVSHMRRGRQLNMRSESGDLDFTVSLIGFSKSGPVAKKIRLAFNELLSEELIENGTRARDLVRDGKYVEALELVEPREGFDIMLDKYDRAPRELAKSDFDFEGFLDKAIVTMEAATSRSPDAENTVLLARLLTTKGDLDETFIDTFVGERIAELYTQAASRGSPKGHAWIAHDAVGRFDYRHTRGLLNVAIQLNQHNGLELRKDLAQIDLEERNRYAECAWAIVSASEDVDLVRQFKGWYPRHYVQRVNGWLEADAVWQVVRESKDPELLRKFIEDFPDSPHVTAAKWLLKSLAN